MNSFFFSASKSLIFFNKDSKFAAVIDTIWSGLRDREGGALFSFSFDVVEVDVEEVKRIVDILSATPAGNAEVVDVEGTLVGCFGASGSGVEGILVGCFGVSGSGVRGPIPGGWSLTILSVGVAPIYSIY